MRTIPVIPDSVYADHWVGESDNDEVESGTCTTPQATEWSDGENAEDVFMDERWRPGSRIESGSALLDRFLQKMVSLRWAKDSAFPPWDNIFHCGCDAIFQVTGISEDDMDFILDVLHWWADSGEIMETDLLPKNADSLKAKHKAMFPDMGEFVGMNCQHGRQL